MRASFSSKQKIPKEEWKLIFVQEIPNWIQVPMMFYIPDCPSKNELTKKVMRHGGVVVAIHECCTYQIKPVNEDIKASDYFPGAVYDSTWILDSIRAGELLNNSEYFQQILPANHTRKIKFNPDKQAFNMMETVKIFQLAEKARRNDAVSSKFWQNVEKEGVLPLREAHQMRKFYKENREKGMIQHLQHCYDKKIRFSHNHQEVPQIGCFEITFDGSATFQAEAQPERGSGQQSITQIFEAIEKKKQKMLEQHMEDQGEMMETEGQRLEQMAIMDKRNCRFVDQNEGLTKKRNEQEMLHIAQDLGITVYQRQEDGRKKELEDLTAQDAFFALLSDDLLRLADKYHRPIDEIHSLFFSVSCDRQKLLEALEKKPTTTWNTLEDLALGDATESLQFKHVEAEKGPMEVLARKKFLEIPLK